MIGLLQLFPRVKCPAIFGKALHVKLAFWTTVSCLMDGAVDGSRMAGSLHEIPFISKDITAMRFLWSALLAIAGFSLCTFSVQAEIVTKEITYTHAGESLKGTLAWDNTISAVRPGVLVVHEWWGLDEFSKSRAIELAKMGYVAFALDMYGEGKSTEHPKQAMEWSTAIRSNKDQWRERALSGLDVLKSHPGVDTNNLAAIGYCFGGSTVLQLAFAGAPLKGVVSFHGALEAPTEGTEVKTKVLICHGAADSFVPKASVEAFELGMDQIQGDYIVAIFSGAKHGFANPHAGSHGIEALAYQESADHRSWSIMQGFFDEIFASSPTKAPVR